MDALVQAFLDRAAQEWAVIVGAPMAFLVCVLLVGAFEWIILKWRLEHEIATRDGVIRIHEERHKAKDERLAAFIDKAQQASPEELKNQLEELAKQFADTKGALAGCGKRIAFGSTSG